MQVHWHVVLSEALELARSGVAHDNDLKYKDAIDAYDKTLITLDEVLLSIPPGTNEYMHILQIREGYDNRMEALRESEMRKSEGLVATLFGGNNGNANSPQRLTFCPLTDAEMNDYKAAAEPAPSSLLLMPYWILRGIGATITHGGFLNNRIFIPQLMWHQVGARFSGIAVKAAAFKNMCACITEHVVPLKQVCRLDEEDEKDTDKDNDGNGNCKYGIAPSDVRIENISLESVHTLHLSFIAVHTEICGVQNTLAKSFPYIPEIEDPNGDKNRSGYSSANGNNGLSKRIPSPSPVISSEKEKETSFLARASGVIGRAGNIFSTGASSLIKNVRKTAEVGMSRINAIHSKATQEEMFMYVSTATAVVDLCQLFQCWYLYLDDVRSELLNMNTCGGSSNDDHDSDAAESSSQGRERDSACAVAAAQGSPERVHVVAMLESTMATLLHITRRIKDTMCEIMLRDIQELHTQYLHAVQASISEE